MNVRNRFAGQELIEEISGAVTHGGRSRGGLLAVHPNPSRRLGPAEMLHREQDRHPIELNKGLGCVARLQSDLLDLAASVVPAGSWPVDQHQIPNLEILAMQFLHHQTRKLVPPAR